MSGSITAVIVSRGLGGLLTSSLQSLRSALASVPDAAHHVVVVDNASDFPYGSDVADGKVDVIRFDVGVSFARANNAAVRGRQSNFYLLLNNDVFLAPHAISDMMRLITSHADIGICGTRLLFPDGSIQHCGVAFGPGSRGPYHHLRKLPAETASRLDREWQAVTGACMLIRSRVWDELDGLDERYPFGLEDIDFCLRARERGWRVCCAGRTDSLHFESLTPGRIALDVESRRLFMERWNGRYTIDG